MGKTSRELQEIQLVTTGHSSCDNAHSLHSGAQAGQCEIDMIVNSHCNNTHANAPLASRTMALNPASARADGHELVPTGPLVPREIAFPVLVLHKSLSRRTPLPRGFEDLPLNEAEADDFPEVGQVEGGGDIDAGAEDLDGSVWSGDTLEADLAELLEFASRVPCWGRDLSEQEYAQCMCNYVKSDCENWAIMPVLKSIKKPVSIMKKPVSIMKKPASTMKKPAAFFMPIVPKRGRALK
eukprot:4578967-Amphidinium_carterae.1